MWGQAENDDNCFAVWRLALKDSDKAKFPHWAELRVVHPIDHFVCKEKWPVVKIYMELWAVINGLALGGGHIYFLLSVFIPFSCLSCSFSFILI